MNCPFCGKEMEQGEIRSCQGGMIYWQPVKEEINRMRYTKSSIIKHDGVVLCGSQNNLTDSKEAYICEECRKFIMSY